MAALPLMEELVDKVLLCLPPDDPASLVRAALVSKQWCRLVSGRGFRRRYREFHGAPPLLGLLCNRADDASFVPTCSFRPLGAERRRGLRAVHACHGRVLLHYEPWGGGGDGDDDDARADLLAVWDPVTGEHRDLPVGPLAPQTWNAAVLCAAAAGDHLDCHGDPFLVVVVGTFHRRTLCLVYSSESNTWKGGYSFASTCSYGSFAVGDTSVLVGGTLYFKCHRDRRILKYDLATTEMSKIRLPKHAGKGAVLMATKDGRLGFAIVRRARLYLWSREHGPDDEDAGLWERSRVIELGALLPFVAIMTEPQVAGFAETGGGVIFIWAGAGFFSIDLKAGTSKEVGESCGFDRFVVPYLSFITPALCV